MFSSFSTRFLPVTASFPTHLIPTNLVLYVCTLFVAGSVAAEEPFELDDVLITAALEPVSAVDVASSVTVITREEIEQRQVKTLSDLLRDVPGFAVSQAGGPGTQTQIRVRGAEANQLLVLIDGIRANDPASADEFQYQYQLTSDVERIEIIRGPQSAIWGTDALAGVINIIRRKDLTSQFLAGNVEYGSFNSINVGLNGGLVRERLQLSGGISHLDTDGTNISSTGPEEDGARNTNLNAALSYSADDTWQLSLSGQHVDARSDFDEVDFFTTGLPVDADRETEASRNYARGEARYEPDDSPLSGSFSINWMNTENKNFAAGVRDSSTSAEKLDFRLISSYLAGAPGAENHRFTAALNYEDTQFAQRGTASPFGDPNQDQSYEVAGYALEYVGKPTERFRWTANARLDDFSDFDNAFTWQLAASRHIAGQFKVRGSVGTGSKAPTFTDRFGFFPGSFIGNPNLKPETSQGWEVGLDGGMKSKRVQFSLAYFNQALKDEIDGFVFDPETFLFTAANKDSKSKRKGLELTISGDVADSFGLTGSYTYLDATESDFSGAPVAEARRPRHMASLNANYRFSANRGDLNLNINYNGNQVDNFFPPPFFAPRQVVLDSFVVADLAASWKLNKQLELVGRISNLLDENYQEILGFARPGRAVYIGLRGRIEP